MAQTELQKLRQRYDHLTSAGLICGATLQGVEPIVFIGGGPFVRPEGEKADKLFRAVKSAMRRKDSDYDFSRGLFTALTELEKTGRYTATRKLEEPSKKLVTTLVPVG